MEVKWACIGCDGLVDPSKKKCYAVNEDMVIRSIKKIKTSINDFIRGFVKDFNIIKGYSLCVCEDHLKEFEEKRKKFERTLAINVIIALILFIGLSALPILLTFNLNIVSFFGSLILALLIFFMSFIYYVPTLSKEPIREKTKKTKRRE